MPTVILRLDSAPRGDLPLLPGGNAEAGPSTVRLPAGSVGPEKQRQHSAPLVVAATAGSPNASRPRIRFTLPPKSPSMTTTKEGGNGGSSGGDKEAQSQPLVNPADSDKVLNNILNVLGNKDESGYYYAAFTPCRVCRRAKSKCLVAPFSQDESAAKGETRYVRPSCRSCLESGHSCDFTGTRYAWDESTDRVIRVGDPSSLAKMEVKTSPQVQTQELPFPEAAAAEPPASSTGDIAIPDPPPKLKRRRSSTKRQSLSKETISSSADNALGLKVSPSRPPPPKRQRKRAPSLIVIDSSGEEDQKIPLRTPRSRQSTLTSKAASPSKSATPSKESSSTKAVPPSKRNSSSATASSASRPRRILPKPPAGSSSGKWKAPPAPGMPPPPRAKRTIVDATTQTETELVGDDPMEGSAPPEALPADAATVDATMQVTPESKHSPLPRADTESSTTSVVMVDAAIQVSPEPQEWEPFVCDQCHQAEDDFTPTPIPPDLTPSQIKHIARSRGMTEAQIVVELDKAMTENSGYRQAVEEENTLLRSQNDALTNAVAAAEATLYKYLPSHAGDTGETEGTTAPPPPPLEDLPLDAEKLYAQSLVIRKCNAYFATRNEVLENENKRLRNNPSWTTPTADEWVEEKAKLLKEIAALKNACDSQREANTGLKFQNEFLAVENGELRLNSTNHEEREKALQGWFNASQERAKEVVPLTEKVAMLEAKLQAYATRPPELHGLSKDKALALARNEVSTQLADALKKRSSLENDLAALQDQLATSTAESSRLAAIEEAYCKLRGDNERLQGEVLNLRTLAPGLESYKRNSVAAKQLEAELVKARLEIAAEQSKNGEAEAEIRKLKAALETTDNELDASLIARSELEATIDTLEWRCFELAQKPMAKSAAVQTVAVDEGNRILEVKQELASARQGAVHIALEQRFTALVEPSPQSRPPTQPPNVLAKPQLSSMSPPALPTPRAISSASRGAIPMDSPGSRESRESREVSRELQLFDDSQLRAMESKVGALEKERLELKKEVEKLTSDSRMARVRELNTKVSSLQYQVETQTTEGRLAQEAFTAERKKATTLVRQATADALKISQLETRMYEMRQKHAPLEKTSVERHDRELASLRAQHKEAMALLEAQLAKVSSDFKSANGNLKATARREVELKRTVDQLHSGWPSRDGLGAPHHPRNPSGVPSMPSLPAASSHNALEVLCRDKEAELKQAQDELRSARYARYTQPPPSFGANGCDSHLPYHLDYAQFKAKEAELMRAIAELTSEVGSIKQSIKDSKGAANTMHARAHSESPRHHISHQRSTNGAPDRQVWSANNTPSRRSAHVPSHSPPRGLPVQYRNHYSNSPSSAYARNHNPPSPVFGASYPPQSPRYTNGASRTESPAIHMAPPSRTSTHSPVNNMTPPARASTPSHIPPPPPSRVPTPARLVASWRPREV